MTKFNLWRFPAFDPYFFVREFLFRMDPEKAHCAAIKLLAKGLGPKVKCSVDPILHTNVCGLQFANPLGLAAGFDKNAEVIGEVLGFGFGFVEIGSITPHPQPGNPAPRMFRAESARAVVNRLGFNSDGMDTCLRRIGAWHDSERKANNVKIKQWERGFVGFNLGINKDCADAAADYANGYKKVAPYADFITLNISSPNTPGLRDLQGPKYLTDILQKIAAIRAAGTHKPPLFVKIAPDLTDAQAQDIATAVMNGDAQGIIVGNTTVTRPGNLPPDIAKEAGGLSGKPLFELSTHMLAQMYKFTQGKVPLIGCGGISSGADAYAKIRAGASLVQLYTALVYDGPGLVPHIARELAALLRRDNFTTLAEAVGSAHEKTDAS